jgi:hypothetical protein
MSAEKLTVVSAGTSPGYALRGHVTRETALSEAEKFYAAQLAAAQSALESIRSGQARVFQQRGIYRVTGRRELAASEGNPGHGVDA